MIALKNLPEELKTEDALRNHFKPYGGISSLSIGSTAAVVTFANRRIAENVNKFFWFFKNK